MCMIFCWYLSYLNATAKEFRFKVLSLFYTSSFVLVFFSGSWLTKYRFFLTPIVDYIFGFNFEPRSLFDPLSTVMVTGCEIMQGIFSRGFFTFELNISSIQFLYLLQIFCIFPCFLSYLHKYKFTYHSMT